MEIAVKCPVCGTIRMARGKVYFACQKCNITFPVESNVVKEIEEKRFRRGYVIVDVV